MGSNADFGELSQQDRTEDALPFTITPEWQQLAIYAAAAALLLILLFNIPYVGRVLRSLFSFAVLAFGLFLLFQQAPFNPGLSRFAQDLGLDGQHVSGEEVRIPMARDGHFWAEVSINGTERRMLVDSGATVTALSRQTAEQAAVETGASLLPVMMQTANGTVPAETGVIEQLRIGTIEARDLKVVISPALGNLDVLGMNFLSQLDSWRVEENTLILVPRAAEPS